MRFRFKTILEISAGLSAGITAGVLAYNRINNEVKALEKPTFPSKLPCTGLECPVTRWDPNWDLRNCESSSNDLKMERNIILIRHGQYENHAQTEEKMVLTELGKQQSMAVAKRLKTLNLPYRSIQTSRMIRAAETAKIIQNELGKIELGFTNNLKEGIPSHCIPPVPGWDYEDGILYTDSQRCEYSFRQLFHRLTKPKGPTFEIVVCHANLIRFFLCRALQFPPEAWIRFSIPNCSMTWITIHGNGTVSARCVGEHTFIPAHMLTF
uniref:Serine/threonine-protein phosphatase PGAM5, mitochondrial n=1 Tax=Lygus hesperus TaxID=30085 RepID=A0A0A9X3C0_LYGHE